jgi:recombination protein RecA
MSKKKSIEPSVIDGLASDLVNTLNTKFKHNIDKAAYFLADPDQITDVKKWIPTGSDMLSLAISNRPNAGWPVGRIIEITGLEASGKSLLAAYALKGTQEQGGLAIYIDTEAATSREYLEAIGIDIEKLVYVPLEALEDIFDTIEATIAKVRKSDKDVLVTIVVDSIMGATTKKELEGEHGKDGYATEKAIVLSKAMRKITNMLARQNICLILTNQLRVRMGVSFGDPYSTSGGKAVGFHSSVRIRLKTLGQIKMKINDVDQVIGIKTRAIIQKNRLGPPLKSVDYDIYFESGIDNYGSWLETLKQYKLASSSTYWTINLTYESVRDLDNDGKPVVKSYDKEYINPNTGELKKNEGVLKFRSKEFGSYMDANPDLRNFIYDMICDRFIMQYKVNKDFGLDDIKVDSDFVGEDD